MTSTGIAYDDRGVGRPALLFLPGWCGRRNVFDPLAGLLADTRRTVAVDWRGHGDSNPAEADFGVADLVDDSLSVIDDAKLATFVPVSAAHAGWVSIELQRRLGPERVPRLVFLDWMVLGAPPTFLNALTTMAVPATTRAVVDQVTAMWVGGLDIAALSAYVSSMAAMPDEMWARAARAIAGAFRRHGNPLDAVASLDPIPPTLHLYAQPSDPAFFAAQLQFARAHRWFTAERLDASSHFPAFEVADTITDRLRDFTAP